MIRPEGSPQTTNPKRVDTNINVHYLHHSFYYKALKSGNTAKPLYHVDAEFANNDFTLNTRHAILDGGATGVLMNKTHLDQAAHKYLTPPTNSDKVFGVGGEVPVLGTV